MDTTDEQAIRDMLAATTPGPWECGSVWVWAGVNPKMFGAGNCAYCGSKGEPVWVGPADINGKIMKGHKHRDPHPYQAEHWISGPDGMVVGNFDYELGGIIEPADATFIAAAPTIVADLLAEVDRLRSEVAGMKANVDEKRVDLNQIACVTGWRITETGGVWRAHVPEVDSQAVEVDRLRGELAAVRELHKPETITFYGKDVAQCAADKFTWPCATARALGAS